MSATPIAIIGQGAVLPGALSPAALVTAVLAGQDLLSTAPPGRWGLDPRSVATPARSPRPDHTWSDRGGYVRGFESLWDPAGFALPAEHFGGLDPLFHQVLHCSRAALQDAGQRRPQPRAGLVLGNLSFPTRGMAALAERSWLEEAGLDPRLLDRAGLPAGDLRDRFMSGLPARLAAQALDLGLGGWSLDAACASGLYAIRLAADRLARREADLMVAAAVNRADDLFIHIGFCALSAMSKTGRSRPFHAEADGLVPAEGCAALVLKRHADALRDGDRVLAVIRGVGLSNDGRGRGLLAPAEEGQGRAIRAAYAQAGLSPADIGLVECHATGTPVGDAAELRSMGAVYADQRDVPIGSLKSNLGHLVTVAGIAAVIKMIGALQAGVCPPTLHCEQANPALAGGPFRLLREAEDWKGPRRAAISAFGFGGNNAHLLLEDPSLCPAPVDRPVMVAVPVEVTGVGLRVGDAASREAVRLRRGRGQPLNDRATAVSLPLTGLRFPPNDLALTLPQHTLLLGAALEAAADAGEALPTRTGVYVGMGTDPQVARYGARWRLPGRARALFAPEAWTAAAQAALAPPLQSAAVLGTMPNLPANRVSFQLGLGGPSFTVSAEQESGAVALELAVAALQAGEIDAAVVGAVDLSADPLHAAAAQALGEGDPPGDGAAVLILRRSGEAASSYGPLIPAPPRARTSRAWAAEGLIDQAVAQLDGAAVAAAGPTMGLYAASSMDGLLAALRSGEPGPGGPLRLALVAADAGALDTKRRLVAELLAKGAALPKGSFFREAPQEGEVAAVFAGAGAAYTGMGEGLLSRWPALGIALGRRFTQWENALSWARSEGRPDAQGQLWASSALCQLHSELSKHTLHLRYSATFGYSSGETNSLLAAGLWADPDAMMADSARCGLFTESLAGSFTAVQSTWGGPVDWALYWLRAPVPQVLAQVERAGPRVHVSIIHTDQDCVIAGERSGVEAVVSAIGRRHALPLPYPLAAHVPELRAVAHTWRALHERTVHPQPGLRVYGGAWGRAYTPDRETCAQALTDQATDTLDIRPLIRAAYDDGVRIFVEHGPQGLLRRWIGEVLGDRPHLAVSLDRRGHGAESTLEALGRLWAASAPMDEDALRRLVAVRPAGLGAGPVFTQPAHPPALRLPALPEAAVADSSPVTYVTVRPSTGNLPTAPGLPPTEGAGRMGGIAAGDARVPQASAHLAPSSDGSPIGGVVHPPAQVGLVTAGGVAAGIAAQMAQIAAIHQQFIAGQAQLQQQFLAGQARLWAALSPGQPTPSFAEAEQRRYTDVTPTNLPPGQVESSEGQGRPVVPLRHEPAWRAGTSPTDGQSQRGMALGAHGIHLHATHSVQEGVLPRASAPAGTNFSASVSLPPGAAAAQASRDFVPLAGNAVTATTSAGGSSAASASPPRGPTAISALQASAPLGGNALAAPVDRAASSSPPAPRAETPQPTETARNTAVTPYVRPPEATPAGAARRAPTGLTLDRQGLMVHAGGAISSIFGPAFAVQDADRRQCRMPLPPLLLADRMTGLEAKPGSMGKGTVWTETDVTADAWYLNRGRMPTGILIESGQADLLLISYLGCDLRNRDERVYRLLGCEMTIHGDLPQPGETLQYEIHVDGHARQGAVRLFFFHYDCHVNGKLRISVRGGQAGFFTDAELAASAGILWTPEEGAATLRKEARLDPPAIPDAPAAFDSEAVAAFAAGRPWDCFGPAWDPCRTHHQTPTIQSGRMLFLRAVTHFAPRGGPWGRGYLRATTPITPEDWFFSGHFFNDPCMPGTLMFEASVQTLSFYMAAMGFTVRRDGWRFQPVQGEPVLMRCRGQVTPQSKELVYEIFVSEVHAGPTPRVWADLLCTVDGLKAFHAVRFGLELVPDWPGAPRSPADPRALVTPEGLVLDKNALLASAVGRPSDAFGPAYARFDAGRHAPRLPGPPYHFITRVRSVSAPFGAMAPGTAVTVELDLPADPLSSAELMEAALQPCGWLASWSGCTLSTPTDLYFRNLDGVSTQHRALRPGDQRLTTVATLTKIARTAGMIIVHFTVACTVDGAPLWDMETSFGFFPAAALASQAGLPAPAAEVEALAAPGAVEPIASRGRLWMIDRVTGRWPTPDGRGRLRAEKDVSPDAWYFKAHFFDDPVQPGSLGVEALLQLLGLHVEAQHPGRPVALCPGGTRLSWRYRGQVLPTNQRVTLLAEITDRQERDGAFAYTATGSLWVDGKRIYALTGLQATVQAEGG